MTSVFWMALGDVWVVVAGALIYYGTHRSPEAMERAPFTRWSWPTCIFWPIVLPIGFTILGILWTYLLMSNGQRNYAGTKGVGYHWHRAAPAFLRSGVSVRVWRFILSFQFRGSEPAPSGVWSSRPWLHFFSNKGAGFHLSDDSVSLRVWRFVVHFRWSPSNV